MGKFLQPIQKTDTIYWKGIAISCVILGHMNLLRGGCHRCCNFSCSKRLWTVSIVFI